MAHWILFAAALLWAAPPTTYSSFTTDYPASYDIQGFDWMSRMQYFASFDGPEKKHTVKTHGRAFEVRWDAQTLEVEVVREKGSVRVPLRGVLEKAREYQETNPGTKNLPQSLLTAESEDRRARVYVEDLSVEWTAHPVVRALVPQVRHLKAEVLYRQRVR